MAVEMLDEAGVPEHGAEASTGVARIRPITREELRARAHELAAVLIDAVEGGASVSFLPPLAPLDAIAWSLGVADEIGPWRTVFVAEVDGTIVGTVQLVRSRMPNQPHRADVSKLLVHRRARRRGLGHALMTALEAAAREAGLSLLVLDTAVGGDGSGLYERLGWRPAGVIPGWAVDGEGSPVDTQFFYKQL